MLTVHCFTYNPFQENTYLLINEKKECIIIDPGCYFENERKEFLQYIHENDLSPVGLLNTHCHLDHIFGNKLSARTWKLELEIHPLEQPVLDAAPQFGLMYNIPFEPSSPPARFLEDGQQIVWGADRLEVILAPGHSPGSVCFFCREQAFIISGDVLFHESIGRSDLPGGDPDVLLRSIRQRLYVLDDNVQVYPGHGPETTIGHEKKHNPFVKG